MKRLFLILSAFISLAHAEPVSVSLDEVPLADLVKLVYMQIVPQPFVMSTALLQARQPVSVKFFDEKPAALIKHIGKLLNESGFTVRNIGGVAWMDQTKLEDEIIVYKPRHRSSRYLVEVVESVTAARSVQSRKGDEDKDKETTDKPASDKSASRQGRNIADIPRSPQKTASGASPAGDQYQPEVDQIAFKVASKDIIKINKLLESLDTAVGEVVLKAAVYEVGFNKSEGSAVRIAASLMAGKLAGYIGGNILSGASIKVAAGGIEAVLSALDADVRFKSISRPQVRVRNGAQARFSVGQDVPVLGMAQMDKNGNPVQSVEYKQSGVILTATPEIRQDVIELTLQQELSTFTVTKTGVNGSPTLIKRAVNTKLGLVPGEVVMLAGLQDEQQDETQSRVPWLDWLLGEERQDKRSEVLVFIEVVRI